MTVHCFASHKMTDALGAFRPSLGIGWLITDLSLYNSPLTPELSFSLERQSCCTISLAREREKK